MRQRAVFTPDPESGILRYIPFQSGDAMVLPLDLLISNNDNAYTLTCAAIRRASQITLAGDEDVDVNDGKVVSTALKQILTKKVEYRLEEE